MKQYITSESVSKGHPDKIADQISDTVLDAYLSHDPEAKVACETLISHNLCVVAGEITSKAEIDIAQTIHKAFPELASFEIVQRIEKQSPDIAAAALFGAADQATLFGYATDETESLMPLAIVYAHKLIEIVDVARHEKMAFLGADAKSQVTVCYDEKGFPCHLDTVIVSTQHSDKVTLAEVREAVLPLIKSALPDTFVTSNSTFMVNPGGRFVLGGLSADTGLTGRKQIVDTYGGMARHAGGAFSGKDASKIDRSGAYLARYIAKNIVKARLACRCEVMLAYAIGIQEPIAISINTFGTETAPQDSIIKAVKETFDLTAHSIIKMLDLKRPIFKKTAYLGHFGRDDPDFTWEKTDKAALLAAL
jgi:S-adenosylmethionine synthetase